MRPTSLATVFSAPCAALVALTLLPISPVAALASPKLLNMPMPLMVRASMNETGGARVSRDMGMGMDSDDSDMSRPHMSATTHKSMRVVRPMRASATAVPAMRGSSMNMHSRALLLERATDFLSQLSGYNDAIQNQSQSYQNLAKQSSTMDPANAYFQQSTAYQMTALHSTLVSINNLFSSTAAQDGLANYNNEDQVQVLLKATVNGSKDMLSSTDVLVYNIPALGPILGPIVYDVKCIVDSLLDSIENITDGALNAIAPLLQSLSGQAGDTTCNTGLDIAGLCL